MTNSRDEYDPNTEAESAYERDCASRLARERERNAPFGSGQSASDSPPTPLVDALEALDFQLSTHLVELNQAIDQLQAGVQRIKRFLGEGDSKGERG